MSARKIKQGYYADPRSPIASTPMKRKRIIKDEGMTLDMLLFSDVWKFTFIS